MDPGSSAGCEWGNHVAARESYSKTILLPSGTWNSVHVSDEVFDKPTLASNLLTVLHHSHLTEKDGFRVEMPLLGRLVRPMCGGCPGSVVPSTCELLCLVGPPGGSHVPPAPGGRMQSGGISLLEWTVPPMIDGCPGSVVPLSCDFLRVVGT